MADGSTPNCKTSFWSLLGRRLFDIHMFAQKFS